MIKALRGTSQLNTETGSFTQSYLLRLKSAQRFSGVAGADRSPSVWPSPQTSRKGNRCYCKQYSGSRTDFFCQGTSIYIWRTFSLVVPWVLGDERESSVFETVRKTDSTKPQGEMVALTRSPLGVSRARRVTLPATPPITSEHTRPQTFSGARSRRPRSCFPRP